jgi:hypothetical protein
MHNCECGRFEGWLKVMGSNKNVKPIWRSDCFYQRELECIWSLYEHEPDIKEPNLQNWRSWERESLDKKWRSK